MPVISVGLRPCDHTALKKLAAQQGRRLEDQAAIVLEGAIRRACPELGESLDPACRSQDADSDGE